MISNMNQDFNLQLISLVKQRPVIWDRRRKDYKQHRVTYEAWREIYKILEPKFDDMTNEKRNEIAKSITKKWSNMKDSWIKCHKRLDEDKKNGKYLYYKDMIFLKKVIHFTRLKKDQSPSGSDKISKKKRNKKTDINDKNEESMSEVSSQTEEENDSVEHETNPFESLDIEMNQDDSDDNSTNPISDSKVPKNKIKEETECFSGNSNEFSSQRHGNYNQFDEATSIWGVINEQAMNREQNVSNATLHQDFTEHATDSRVMHFFKSIAPTVDSFCDDDIFDFQFEVLKVIKKLKEK